MSVTALARSTARNVAIMSAEDAAYVAGAAFQRMAIALGITEAELYADFARRAAEDPDCQVIR